MSHDREYASIFQMGKWNMGRLIVPGQGLRDECGFFEDSSLCLLPLDFYANNRIAIVF